MNKEIDLIIPLFPDFKQKIDFLFQTDENFRDICEEYRLCTGRLLELKREEKNNGVSIQEYEDLQQSLKQELLEQIIQNKNC